MDTYTNHFKNMFRFKISVIFISFIIMILTIILSISSGTINFTITEVIGAIIGNYDDTLARQVVFNVRLPRVLTGMLAGINLAVSGALLQGILRNPMASPSVIGVNAGAGLMAVVIMIFFPGRVELIPIAAFVGAMLSTFIIFALSSKSSEGSETVHIVLVGMALSSFLGAITSALMTLNVDEMAASYSWLLGTLSGRGWSSFNTLLPYTIVGLSCAFILAPKANIFALGDELGNSVGISITLYRTIIIIVSALLAGSAVSVVGSIGFIGLVAPHIARVFVGSDYKYLILLSAICGAILLVLSDTIARTMFQPFELSVGIVTSVLGAPFFIFLLYKKKGVSL